MKTPTQTDGRTRERTGSPRGASPSGLKGQKACKHFLKGTCCKNGDRCHFRHAEAGGQPSKRTKQRDGKGTVALEIVCPKIALRESPFCGNMGKWDRITQSSSRRPRCVPQKKIGKRRFHRRASFNNANFRNEFCGLQISRNPRKMKSSGKSGALAKQPGTWQRMPINNKKGGRKRYGLLSCRSLGNAGTLFDKARTARSRDRLWSMHTLSKRA